MRPFSCAWQVRDIVAAGALLCCRRAICHDEKRAYYNARDLALRRHKAAAFMRHHCSQMNRDVSRLTL
jgi:hypothetical protein